MAQRLLIGLPLLLPLYLLRFKLGPLPTTALEIYLLVLFAVFTYERGVSGWVEGWKKLGDWRWPIAVWMFASLAACFWAPSIISGLGLWRAYVLEPLLVFVMMPVLLAGERERRHFEYALCGLVGWVTLWAIFQFVTGIGIPHPWDVSFADGRRATGPFPYPNALALLVVPIGAWAFAKKHWWVAAAALLSAVLARSDGGVGALLIACWVVLVCDKRFRRWAVGVAVIGALVVAAVPSVRGSFIQSFTLQGWSGQVRLFQWRETWQMLQDHPLFGAGFGGYPTVFAPYHKATAIEIFQYPHTIIFNFWSETGLLGLVAFMWIVWTWVRVSSIEYRRTDNEGRYSLLVTRLAPLIAILIHGLVDVPYFKNDLAIVFWMLVFLTTRTL